MLPRWRATSQKQPEELSGAHHLSPAHYPSCRYACDILWQYSKPKETVGNFSMRHRPVHQSRPGEALIQRLRVRAFIVGTALFVGAFLVLTILAGVQTFVVLGVEFAIICFWRFVRAFVGPLAANRSLRKGQILLAVPVGAYSAAAFLAAWPETSKYAPWVFLIGVLTHFGVSRRYIRKLARQVHKAE